MTMQLVRPMAYADVEAGMTIPPRSFTVQRRDLIRYAGSACDYNGIHWDDRLAADVGLPSPIAHGMFSMGLALTALTDWAGDPGSVVDFGGKFPRLVPVPNDGVGARIDIEATVVGKLDPPRVRVQLVVRFNGEKAVTMPRVILALR